MTCPKETVSFVSPLSWKQNSLFPEWSVITRKCFITPPNSKTENTAKKIVTCESRVFVSLGSFDPRHVTRSPIGKRI